jgi:hypothetical protein
VLVVPKSMPIERVSCIGCLAAGILPVNALASVLARGPRPR